MKEINTNMYKMRELMHKKWIGTIMDNLTRRPYTWWLTSLDEGS
jgi:hypothetical protein